MMWEPVIQMKVLKIGSGIVSAPWTTPQVCSKVALALLEPRILTQSPRVKSKERVM